MATAIENPIDLQPFCDDHDGRYALGKPWRSGDFVIATDGRILIELDAKLAPDIQPPAMHERVPMRTDDIFCKFTEATEWQPCPQITACEACQGTEEIRGHCDFCNGHCDHECACGHEHQCGQCDGTGKMFVDHCKACRVEFGGRKFRPTFVKKVLQLPNVQVAQAPSNLDMLYFKFDGGRGALMALTE